MRIGLGYDVHQLVENRKLVLGGLEIPFDKGLLGDTIKQGKLIPILPEHQPVGGLPMYAVFPEKEFMPAKTRALISFLMQEMPLY